MDTASCALDEFAFIDADEVTAVHSPLTILDEEASGTKGTDSGLGSEGSNQSCTTSPARSSVHLEEDEGFETENKRNFPPITRIRITLNGEVMHAKKKDKEEDDESLCRTRLNSGAHSGSPMSISAFSSDGGSPTRRASLPTATDGANSTYAHYNTFVPSGHNQHVTASHPYVNGGVTGRTANFSVDIFEAFDDVEYYHESTSDTLAIFRSGVVLRPRLLKRSAFL
ncbi:unnamed protein product [Toxocara canis]|uniref:Uncharacterized protein n=1 Tax=Toxocara canis TaxID=6265 RepID=A0A183VDP5_TOXCA|nr:unnamed protein product [Toxocara canis]